MVKTSSEIDEFMNRLRKEICELDNRHPGDDRLWFLYDILDRIDKGDSDRKASPSVVG